MKKSKLKRLLSSDWIEELLLLHSADCMGSNGDLSDYHFMKYKLDDWEPEEIKPEPMVRGKDLISLGFTPGPIFKTILDYIETLQLEGEISTKEEALERVKERFNEK